MPSFSKSVLICFYYLVTVYQFVGLVSWFLALYKSGYVCTSVCLYILLVHTAAVYLFHCLPMLYSNRRAEHTDAGQLSTGSRRRRWTPRQCVVTDLGGVGETAEQPVKTCGKFMPFSFFISLLCAKCDTDLFKMEVRWVLSSLSLSNVNYLFTKKGKHKYQLSN